MFVVSTCSSPRRPIRRPTKNPDYPHHLSAVEAAEIGEGRRGGELVLTHIPPYLDASVSVAEAEAVFGRPVRLAVPGTSLDV